MTSTGSNLFAILAWTPDIKVMTIEQQQLTKLLDLTGLRKRPLSVALSHTGTRAAAVSHTELILYKIDDNYVQVVDQIDVEYE